MKGTFSRYNEKTGKGAITPVADTAGQGFSFGASAGQFLTAKEFKFRGKRGRIYLNCRPALPSTNYSKPCDVFHFIYETGIPC